MRRADRTTEAAFLMRIRWSVDNIGAQKNAFGGCQCASIGLWLAGRQIGAQPARAGRAAADVRPVVGNGNQIATLFAGLRGATTLGRLPRAAPRPDDGGCLAAKLSRIVRCTLLVFKSE